MDYENQRLNTWAMAGVSVLQLDTNFPRLPGDIACDATYQVEFEAIRVPNTRITSIITDAPSKIDISPYIEAAKTAKGDVITTSCGFLAPFQSDLERALDRPFVVSSLTDLPPYLETHSVAQVAIFTFDVRRLSHAHLLNLNLAAVPLIFGLEPTHLLHKVITQDRNEIDQDRATEEVLALVDNSLPSDCEALFLECTNLPVYKNAIKSRFELEIFDILSSIEAAIPGAINPKFL